MKIEQRKKEREVYRNRGIDIIEITKKRAINRYSEIQCKEIANYCDRMQRARYKDREQNEARYRDKRYRSEIQR